MQQKEIELETEHIGPEGERRQEGKGFGWQDHRGFQQRVKEKASGAPRTPAPWLLDYQKAQAKHQNSNLNFSNLKYLMFILAFECDLGMQVQTGTSVPPAGCALEPDSIITCVLGVLEEPS